MAGLLALLLLAGIFFYLIWYFFYRSVLWVAEPLIEYFENREAERFIVEDFGEESLEDIDLGQIHKNKVKISIKDFDKPIHLSKSLLQKAKKEPQKLAGTNLWIYKDYIFSIKPTEGKLKEIFGDKEEKQKI
jgi:hypothetical protein